jgi:plasmid stability protein
VTVILSLPPEMEKKLHERAAASGQDVAAYVHDLITKELTSRAVDDALALFRKQVEKSGITDEELNKFFEEARDEAWREKHGNAS